MTTAPAHQTGSADAQRVSLVIPGRNCADTLEPCLAAAVTILEQPDSPLAEIIFVDDGSTDATPQIAQRFTQVRMIKGEGRGPGAARNLGWQAAQHDLIWFIDADCVAEPDALAKLLPHLSGEAARKIAAVGGSYGTMRPHSPLATLIHEEIVARHTRMGSDVNFLATFNVLYLRSVLAELNGFDERYLKGQDAELAFRALEAGWRLQFQRESRVKHFHADRWGKYLRTQYAQGYWRAWLHARHRGHARGDSYSSLLDHLQPLLGVAFPFTVPLALIPRGLNFWLDAARWIPAALLCLLLLMQLPMTARLVQRTKRPVMLWFPLMGVLRAVVRGYGLVAGVIHYVGHRGGLPQRRLSERNECS